MNDTIIHKTISDKLIIGIDASRNRSGGAVAHLIGILGEAEPQLYGIEKIHIWSYNKLLLALPDRSWLIKHNPRELEGGILSQLYWQRFRFAKDLTRLGCDIVFNTDAGTVGRFKPSVTLSQDLLSYEPGEMERVKWGMARLRIWLLWFMQNRSLRHAKGTIFLTKYASEIIQRATGTLPHVAIIPHGVHEYFRNRPQRRSWPGFGEREIRCIYVSNTSSYKHQWHVVNAIFLLRSQGYPVNLTLVGGGYGPAQRRLEAAIKKWDPSRIFVEQHAFVANEDLPKHLLEADLFVFASSCENMPVTLIEGMSSGIPIACSDRGPMPEVLGMGGVYFDPEVPTSIASAISMLIDDPELRLHSVKVSSELSESFSWKRCADETFAFIAETYQNR